MIRFNVVNATNIFMVVEFLFVNNVGPLGNDPRTADYESAVLTS